MRTLAFLLALVPVALADEAPALGGHDPVAYFPEGGARALPGTGAFTARHGGATYRFASATHRDLFKKDPARFLPAYGGHDPDALADGREVKGDPAVFRVRGRDLFLFASPAARDRWLRAEVERIRAANEAWAGRDASTQPVRRAPAHWNAPKGLALGGFDPVAYFPEGGGKPLAGDAATRYRYGGVTYHFATAAHREQFKTNPERYEPAYGGWCAYAVGKAGKKVSVDPRAFLVQDGRLLVFFRNRKLDTRDPWRRDLETLGPAAEANWRALTKR